jgi:hypothetical protein
MTDKPNDFSARGRAPGAPFLTIGVVFIAVGSSGQRAFIAIGAAFIAVGVALLVRQRRAGGPK